MKIKTTFYGLLATLLVVLPFTGMYVPSDQYTEQSYSQVTVTNEENTTDSDVPFQTEQMQFEDIANNETVKASRKQNIQKEKTRTIRSFIRKFFNNTLDNFSISDGFVIGAFFAPLLEKIKKLFKKAKELLQKISRKPMTDQNNNIISFEDELEKRRNHNQ